MLVHSLSSEQSSRVNGFVRFVPQCVVSKATALQNPFCDASGRLPQIAAGVKGLSCDDFLTREVPSYQRITRTDNQVGRVLCYTSCPNRGRFSPPRPMDTSVQPRRVYRFGLFEADAISGQLLRRGTRVKLQDQPFRLLVVLLGHAGEVVSREQLRQQLWPSDTYVEFDGSLNNTLKKLRSALGDSPENPTFIETIPKRGYRFIAPVAVEEVQVEAAAPAAVVMEQSPVKTGEPTASHRFETPA